MLALTCDFLCPSMANAVTVSKKVATECQSSKPLKNKSFDHLCDQKSAVVLMPQAGFEPATPGLGNRDHKNVTHLSNKDLQKQPTTVGSPTGPNSTDPLIRPLDPTLLKLIDAWKDLPKKIKKAIELLAESD